jgi:AraC-like DNA-binding protein
MSGNTRAATIQGWDNLVIDLGADPAIIYEQSGLTSVDLQDPDAVLPSRVIAKLLDLAAIQTNCPHFGLLLAKRRDLRVYLGLLGQIIQASADIGEALRESIKWVHLHTQANRWELNTKDEVVIMTCRPDEYLEFGSVQGVQVAMGAFWRMMRLLSDGAWHPTMVSFTFAKPENTLVYKRFFNVPVLFGGDDNFVIFHAEDLQIPLPRHDQYLLEVLGRYAETIQVSRRRSLKDEVRDLLRKNLQSGKAGIEEIVRFFPFEQRTLQRQLTQLGTSFTEILHEVRMGIAQDRLLNSDVSIARLADSLGYRDQGSFTKAFKRHTDLTPMAWRRQSRHNTKHPPR